MKTTSLCGPLLVVLAIGCGKQPQQPAVPAPAPQQPSQAETAKALVQEYIDRVIGGDLKTKDQLLGSSGVDFASIDSIEITSAVPAYSKEGTKIDNWIQVGIRVQGTHFLRGSPLEKKLVTLVAFKEGQCRILGPAS
jgi:hypothetical protein